MANLTDIIHGTSSDFARLGACMPSIGFYHIRLLGRGLDRRGAWCRLPQRDNCREGPVMEAAAVAAHTAACARRLGRCRRRPAWYSGTAELCGRSSACVHRRRGARSPSKDASASLPEHLKLCCGRLALEFTVSSGHHPFLIGRAVWQACVKMSGVAARLHSFMMTLGLCLELEHACLACNS